MKDNIVNPPEKDPNLIMTVADQGQGGLKAKTRSNSTTQLSIALTKDNPAITTPKRSSKRNPSETAEDGAMKGRSLFPSAVPQVQDVTVNTRPNPTTPLSIELTKDNPPDPTTSKSQRKHPPPSKTAEDGAVQGRSLVAYITKLKVSKFHRLYKKAWRQEMFALATAQRVITTGEKSPRFWEFSLVFDLTLIVQRAEPLTCMCLAASEFFANPAIIPHIVEEFERLKQELQIAKAQSKFPPKQGWNQTKLLRYLHTTTILFYDVCAAHQKWSPTMGSNYKKSQEMALKSTRTAPEHAQDGLEATTRSNSTTLLTVDLVKDNPCEHKFSMLYSIFDLFLSLEKIQQTDFLGLPFQIPTNRVGAPICPLTDDLRELHSILSLEKVPTKFLCIPGEILASCLYFPTNSGSANLSPDMID
ncbi:unnamed protein product [Cylindrotheca closterium]|uniref:Uncharacterized protein n=1 Tax=Cylindrotheca closterium TaxID=2856 RepID=A0AAD2FWQ1_9STRA|nr:unnamed protein product [Cylindrotheca closterium]